MTVQAGISVMDALGGGFADRGVYVPGSAAEYCRRLCRYIIDDSTVRARCIDHFGHAPSLEGIAAIRAEPSPADRLMAHLREAPPIEGKPFRVAVLPEELSRRQKEAARRARDMAAAAKEPLPVPAASEAAWSWQALVALVAADFGMTARMIMGRGRSRRITRVRNLICALMTARGRTLGDIAHRLGRKDHTTIAHALRQFRHRDMMDADIAAAWAKWSVLSGAASPAGMEAREGRTLVQATTKSDQLPGGYVLTADSGGCCEVAAPEGTSAARPGGHVRCANAAKHRTHSDDGKAG